MFGDILSLSHTMKKSVIALALTLPLALAACGSDKNDAAESSAAATTTVANSAAAKSTVTATASSAPSAASVSATANAATPSANAPAAADAASPTTLANPLENVQVSSFAPLPSGTDDPAVRQEITKVVSGLYSEQRFKPAMEYTIANSCAAIAGQFRQQLDAAGAGTWASLPDTLTYADIYNMQAQANGTTSQFPGMPTLDSVTDLKVDGNNASATINVKNPDGTVEGNTMIFANEGGSWKICTPTQ